jgi:hypothetical protein
MNRHALWILLVPLVLVASSGCCEVGAFLSCPLGPIAVCDPTHCAVPCGDACSVDCGGCGDCGYGDGGCVDSGCVDACAEPCCNACGDICGDVCGGSCCDACTCCDPCGSGWFLWKPFFWLLGDCGWGGCAGGGCGEFYWSDFHSEPPDCCDPCDRWGNWTGGCGAGCGAECGGARGGAYCAAKPAQNGYVANGPAMNRGVVARPASRRVAGQPTARQPVARRAAGNSNRAVPAWALRGLEGPVITDPSSPYAPKLVSVTDHGGSPTLADAESAKPKVVAEPEVAKPSVRQASTRR